MYMEKEEIIKKLNEIRKTRIIDIYAEEEFFGKGLIINKEGKTYIYNWCISLCIEENLAKEVYELEEYNIDISKININFDFDENKNDRCINIINFDNLKIENSDLSYYNKIMEEVLKHLRTMRDTWKEVMRTGRTN